MKALEQLLVRARTRWRTRRAAGGGGERPARLVLRLDDHDAAAETVVEMQPLSRWFEGVVRVVEDTGPLPVCVVARADHGFLGELARFAHRLECPTTVRTSVAELDLRRAEDLVDSGVVGVALRADTGLGAAIAAVRAASADRRAPIDVEVEVPIDPYMRDRFAEARTGGADGVRVIAWRGGPWDPATAAALAWAANQHPPFHRTRTEAMAAFASMNGDGPGVSRTGGRCPVGALRLEFGPDGRVSACPHKEGAVAMEDTLEATWERLGAHRAAIRACGRACWHPELAPLP